MQLKVRHFLTGGNRTWGFATVVWQERVHTRVPEMAHMPALKPLCLLCQNPGSLRHRRVICLSQRKHVPPIKKSSKKGFMQVKGTHFLLQIPQFPLWAMGSLYRPSVPHTGVFFNCLIVGHTAGFDCIGPQGASKSNTVPKGPLF